MSYSIQRILVPVDLSESSLNALNTALMLAKIHHASIHVLNVIEPVFDHLAERPGIIARNPMNTSDVLSALISTIQNAHGIDPSLLQEEGTVGRVIERVAYQTRTDLIVMGSHGASGFRDGFIGSNTYCAMKYAPCPVLMIPLKRKYDCFRKVLFPVRPVAGALNRYDVVSCLLTREASMDVLCLSYRKHEKDTNLLEKITGEIKSQLDVDKVRSRVEWGSGQVMADDVLEYAQHTSTDLIVVTSLLDVTTKPGFIGPHSQKIINCAKVAVLNIKRLPVPSFAY